MIFTSFNDNDLPVSPSIPPNYNDIIKNAIKERLIKYVKWNELTNISKVGTGHFGSVSKAHWLNTNDYVVLKKLNNSNDIQEDALQREIRMQIRAYNCDSIIRFIGITQGMHYYTTKTTYLRENNIYIFF